jgi:hypothetical protein
MTETRKYAEKILDNWLIGQRVRNTFIRASADSVCIRSILNYIAETTNEETAMLVGADALEELIFLLNNKG